MRLFRVNRELGCTRDRGPPMRRSSWQITPRARSSCGAVACTRWRSRSLAAAFPCEELQARRLLRPRTLVGCTPGAANGGTAVEVRGAWFRYGRDEDGSCAAPNCPVRHGRSARTGGWQWLRKGHAAGADGGNETRTEGGVPFASMCARGPLLPQNPKAIVRRGVRARTSLWNGRASGSLRAARGSRPCFRGSALPTALPCASV